jgi:hypothetical protein
VVPHFVFFVCFVVTKSKAASEVEEPVPIPSHDDERQSALTIVAQFGAPAFMRRANRVESVVSDLIDRLRVRRNEQLQGVRLHLRMLLEAAGSLDAARAFLSDEQFTAYRALVADFGLTEREPTGSSPRRLRGAVRELVESVVRFNRRWLECVAEADLSAVNAERDGYNRWYLLEKECAVGVIRGRQGFRPLPPLTTADVLHALPPLVELNATSETPLQKPEAINNPAALRRGPA